MPKRAQSTHKSTKKPVTSKPDALLGKVHTSLYIPGGLVEQIHAFAKRKFLRPSEGIRRLLEMGLEYDQRHSMAWDRPPSREPGRSPVG